MYGLGISWMGESNADDGSVIGMWYFGVKESFECVEINDGSISDGNV